MKNVKLNIPEFKRIRLKEPIKYTTEQFKNLIDFKDTVPQYFIAPNEYTRDMKYFEIISTPRVINNGKRQVYLTLVNLRWNDNNINHLKMKLALKEYCLTQDVDFSSSIDFRRPLDTCLKDNESFTVEGFYRYSVKRINPVLHHKKTGKCAETMYHHRKIDFNKIFHNYALVLSRDNYDKMKNIFEQGNGKKDTYVLALVSDFHVKDCSNPIEFSTIIYDNYESSFVDFSLDKEHKKTILPDYGPGNKSNSKLKRMQFLSMQDIFCIDELSTHKGQIK